ncbi:ribonuclease H-like domain-containing protein [Tanacetum coccineum]
MSVYNSEHNYPINSDNDDDVHDPVTRISKLDISDPLHLHPNDTIAPTVVSIKLKGTENYQVWSCAMLLALEGKNKIGFIDGSCKRSNTDEVLGKQWDRVNAIVLGWILNSISEKLFLGQKFSNRAKHVWQELKKTYDKVDGSIMFGLHNQINTLKQNGSSIADYYHKLNALWKQYDVMIELPKCVCNASEGFKKHNQLLKLMQFLMGLDDSYMQIRSSILSRETLPDVRSAYDTISSEESHRVAVDSIAGSSQRNQASAFMSNVPNSEGSGLNNNRQGGSSGLVCENCGFNGHTIDRCFKIIGYPADFGKKKANQHMTYTDKELDNVIDISHLKIKVGHPNGIEAYISKIGNLRLSNGLTLYDVMVIPEYCVTLIYVHKLVKENKVIVAFDENICYFLNQDLNLKNILGIGKQCEGLYYYNDKGIKSNNSTLRFQCLLSQHDWHCRLGHSTDPVLNVLKDSLNIDKKDNTVCYEICQRDKQTREHFPLSDHSFKRLGDLVHLDLWGPYKVTGSEGFKFFLTIVDDYTRAVWVYLIKSKDEDSEVEKNDSVNVFQDVNHINFFDIEYPEIPNDDERVANDLNKDKSDSSNSSMSGSNINTTDFPVDSGNDADSSDDLVATQNEEVATLEENVFSEGNLDKNPSSSQGVQNARRSSRQSVFLRNYNDFVVESKVKYGLEKYVGYLKLNFEIFCFVTQLNKTREPKTYFEASKYSHWTDAMNQEMDALLRNGTWELVDIPEGRKAIGRIDYEETFSLVVKMVTVRCLLNIAVSMSWPIFQLDLNNAFLYGDLEEVVFMKPPEGYFPSDNKSDKGVFLALLVYVDDIIITDTDKGICLNQRKYVLDEYGMLACKPVKTPLMSKLVISNEASENDPLLVNFTDYQKLMRRLIYLTNTRPDISYVVHCLGIHIARTSGMFLNAYSDADWAKFSLHCDNNSAIKIAVNPVFHERTKHLEIDLYFVREKILKGVVKIVKVDYANKIADILTKGLDTVQHLELVKRLGFKQGLTVFDQRLKDEGLLLPSVDYYKSFGQDAIKDSFSSFDLDFGSSLSL